MGPDLFPLLCVSLSRAGFNLPKIQRFVRDAHLCVLLFLLFFMYGGNHTHVLALDLNNPLTELLGGEKLSHYTYPIWYANVSKRSALLGGFGIEIGMFRVR